MTPLGLSALDEGMIVGILIGEGHFGGDGRQPHITLRMHVRHEALLRWLHARIPRSRLYGPYHHGDRHYFQWMARGPALTQDLMPLLERHVGPDLDGHTYARLVQMRERYADVFDRAAARAGREAAARDEPPDVAASAAPRDEAQDGSPASSAAPRDEAQDGSPASSAAPRDEAQDGSPTSSAAPRDEAQDGSPTSSAAPRDQAQDGSEARSGAARADRATTDPAALSEAAAAVERAATDSAELPGSG